MSPFGLIVDKGFVKITDQIYFTWIVSPLIKETNISTLNMNNIDQLKAHFIDVVLPSEIINGAKPKNILRSIRLSMRELPPGKFFIFEGRPNQLLKKQQEDNFVNIGFDRYPGQSEIGYMLKVLEHEGQSVGVVVMQILFVGWTPERGHLVAMKHSVFVPRHVDISKLPQVTIPYYGIPLGLNETDDSTVFALKTGRVRNFINNCDFS